MRVPCPLPGDERGRRPGQAARRRLPAAQSRPGSWTARRRHLVHRPGSRAADLRTAAGRRGVPVTRFLLDADRCELTATAHSTLHPVRAVAQQLNGWVEATLVDG